MIIKKYFYLLMLYCLLGCSGRSSLQNSFDYVGGQNAQFESTYNQIVSLLEKKAYAFNADFHLAGTKIGKSKSLLAKQWAKGKANFASSMHSILKKEFKVSHLECIYYSGKGRVDLSLPRRREVTRSHHPKSEFEFRTFNHSSKNVAYLRIPDFEFECPNTLDLQMAQALNCTHMIVDLRGNFGGYMDKLTKVLSYFLTSNEVACREISRMDYDLFKQNFQRKPLSLLELVEFKNNTQINPWRAWQVGGNSSMTYTGQVIVLVDGGTQSCSEILASALKDLKNAQVIGTNTGKACLGAFVNQIGSFYITYPECDCVSPAGYRLEGHGVRPTIHSSSGSAYRKALSWIARN